MLPGLLAFLVVTLAHLVGQVMAPDGLVTDVTQVLLMPALAWVLLGGTPTPKSRLVRLTLLALAFSWLGDTLPRLTEGGGQLGFSLMLGAFLLAQLTYVVAFLPFAGRSVARTRPAVLLLYVVALAALIAPTAGGADAFLPAIVVYGVIIIVMAVLATGIDRVGAAGGVLFLVSDALIALDAFAGLALPVHGFWVMLTYALAQALLVVAVAHHDREVAPRVNRHRRRLGSARAGR